MPSADQQGPRRSMLASCFAVGAIVLVVFSLIWIPWFKYNFLAEIEPLASQVQAARGSPSDTLLAELASYPLGTVVRWQSQVQLVQAARRIMRGRVEIPGFEPAALTRPFSVEEMSAGPSAWQLFLHGLGIPKVLLDAYRATSDTALLAAAADYLVSYDEYESSGWQPGGYLWSDTGSLFVRNDHAIAGRAGVLTEFWSLYRQSPQYEQRVGRAVFRMAARYATLLSDPRHFTVTTNHGMMQNLALCQLGLAFPTLPRADGFCEFAFTRLNGQIGILLDRQGFMLEHSPGYQAFDLALLGLALRYHDLAHLHSAVPWLGTYQLAVRTYADLRRPDGTLPDFGDTAGPSPLETLSWGGIARDSVGHEILDQVAQHEWRPLDRFVIDSIGGYAIWWNRLGAPSDAPQLSQTAITWSYVPGLGHKHADELSVALWAGGISWWENVGYWPYDDPRRGAAESWDGSNAPHLVGESAETSRAATLRSYGTRDSISFADIERRGPGAFTARRQVLGIGSQLWLVLDASTTDLPTMVRTVWTTAPDVAVSQEGRAYHLAAAGGHRLQEYVEGSPGTTWRLVKPDRAATTAKSVVGWTAITGEIRPTTSIVVEQPSSGSWALAAWSLSDSAHSVPAWMTSAPRVDWRSPDDWTVTLATQGGPTVIRRARMHLELSGPAPIHTWSLSLGGTPSPESTRRLHDAVTAARRTYYTPNMSFIYRAKASGVLLLGLIGAIALFAISTRLQLVRSAIAVVALGALWLAMSCYLILLRVPLI